jgi:hypothetical protein
MRYRIEYADGRCCNFANSRKDLLDWLKLLKHEKIADIRKVYKNGVTDSVLDNYRRYLKTVKGADSHGSCKNYYKNFVIAGAYMPDNHTAGGYVHHMAVCNGISYPVGNHLYHSCIGVWIRTGNRHRGIQNACNGLYTVCFAYPRRLDCGVAGSNQN